MSEIDREAKTLKRGEGILMPMEVEALYDFKHVDLVEVLTSNP